MVALLLPKYLADLSHYDYCCTVLRTLQRRGLRIVDVVIVLWRGAETVQNRTLS